MYSLVYSQQPRSHNNSMYSLVYPNVLSISQCTYLYTHKSRQPRTHNNSMYSLLYSRQPRTHNNSMYSLVYSRQPRTHNISMYSLVHSPKTSLESQGTELSQFSLTSACHRGRLVLERVSCRCHDPNSSS